MSDNDVKSSEESEELELEPPKSKRKKLKLVDDSNAGILYMSRVPSNMTVKVIRDLFSSYGEIGRIFLQADERRISQRKSKRFNEGWIEFADKKLAKRVAVSLNNQIIGGKRHLKWRDEIWNLKYLPKFKWTHLNERLAYEKAVHQQRMRTEVSQAKKVASFFKDNVEKSKMLKRKKVKTNLEEREWTFSQKETETEILSSEKHKRTKKKKDSLAASENTELMKSIFSGGL
ncbi:DgyrCDS946 [Dimorphilus gyrociliatus]|uniref:Activator of basal transcription 1 n=1 Tax=Dimorphilus gyrociliatus TaxID=2664684 RepID=A0A7I8V7B8_9ANNE|nr:DgyrCDS946 [Dimorphilus gyrociliatus]